MSCYDLSRLLFDLKMNESIYQRSLEDFEATPLTVAAALLLGFALLGFFAPHLLAWPVAALAAWVGITFLAEAWTVWRHR